MHAPKAAAINAPASPFNFPSGSAANSSGGHATRRIVLPGRYNSDPYVAPVNHFAPTHQERRHHVVMVHIGMHAVWCKYVFCSSVFVIFSAIQWFYLFAICKFLVLYSFFVASPRCVVLFNFLFSFRLSLIFLWFEFFVGMKQ